MKAALLFLLVGVSLSCSSFFAKKRANPILTFSIGDISENELSRFTERLASNYSYRIEKYDVYGSGLARIETQWRQRQPFEDELDNNITLVQTKIYIETQSKVRTNTYRLYRITMRIEQVYHRDFLADPVYLPLSEMGEEEINYLVNDMTDWLRGRLRGNATIQ